MLRTTHMIFVFVAFASYCFGGATKSADTLNKFDRYGKRTGYWVLGENNQAAFLKSPTKQKEGRYLNGRKVGVWITYFEDGKTPRLIGEYADNRPAGAYFRFNRKGELQQASSVPRKIAMNQTVKSSNSVFSCKLNFDNKEIVAGQVYFSQKVIKNNAVQFWMEKSLQAISSESKVINFSWLNNNYEKLYATYLEVRSPKRLLSETSGMKKMNAKAEVKVSGVQASARKGNYFFPPQIRSPRLAKGMVFQPNGLNKLYTNEDEIWIDGYFQNGQLSDGKVFVYDRDGVLLKVRVYKKGVYHSDGVL